ncbi:MAG: hypothetical protein Q7Q71_16430 [Verrucomicrobiota bacterium JB023]|nr:hypothetical protein [Verrucomicrobiota bacterium JB023]
MAPFPQIVSELMAEEDGRSELPVDSYLHVEDELTVEGGEVTQDKADQARVLERTHARNRHRLGRLFMGV